MRRLPLFVLPTILFPGTRMPLHIFEPRYRQMAARCLESDKQFGLLFRAAHADGEYNADDGGVGCVAYIEQFQPLPDGRSLLIVEGRERFRVVDGIESDTLYHEALVEDYVDEGERAYDLAPRRQKSLALYAEALQKITGAPRAPSFDTARDLSFQLADAMEVDAAWKQMLLELRSESQRLDQIDMVLRAALESDE